MLTPLSPDTTVAEPPRPVPPGAKRWGWHSYVYGISLTATLIAEAHGIWRNRHRNGLDDFQHRTFSENTWAVFAMHPDTHDTARYGKARRFAFTTFMGWFGPHIRSNGKEM